MSKHKDNSLDLPEIDMKSQKAKRVMGHEEIVITRKKVVPTHLENEEVELFEEAFKNSTAKSEKEFAKSIILNHLRNK